MPADTVPCPCDCLSEEPYCCSHRTSHGVLYTGEVWCSQPWVPEGCSSCALHNPYRQWCTGIAHISSCSLLNRPFVVRTEEEPGFPLPVPHKPSGSALCTRSDRQDQKEDTSSRILQWLSPLTQEALAKHGESLGCNFSNANSYSVCTPFT